jgi:hypothetical protein
MTEANDGQVLAAIVDAVLPSRGPRAGRGRDASSKAT